MSWENKFFIDFVLLQRGHDLTKEQIKPGLYPVVTSTSIMGYHNAFKAEGPGVVTGRSGTIGEVQYIEENYWPHNTSLYVKDFKGNYPKFVFYFLKNFGTKQAKSGSAVPTLNRNNLSKILVRVPDLATQHRIASILSAYDDLIENNQKQIKLLEEAAQRLYKEWFVDLHFPGWKNTPIVDGVPDGWRLKPMDDIADYINGYAFKPSDWGTVGKPIIKIREMGLGVTADTPRNTGKNIPEKYNITAGDILFSWSATLSAMIWDEEDGLLNQHLFKVIPYDGVSREFVLQSILKTLDEFSNLTTGSTMKHIQRGKLKEVHVIVPPENIMHNYELISEPIREQLLSLKQQIILLQESRDRLLPKLMNGELEIQMN
ncbi:MAG: restriction endonuclease subunit S [Desulfovibrionaceae bacterium]|nr:restriction endonuclease subunit S [Desulfovibrionaceae bacterium]